MNDFVWGANEAPFGAGRAYVHLSRIDDPTVYCQAKTNSQGCLPQIAWSGIASLSVGTDLELSASNVLNNKNGLLFWGFGGANLPFFGGTLCVQPPLRRTTIQPSGGNLPPANDCSGTYAFSFSKAYMASEGIAPGMQIHAQFWSRDPADADQIGLTNAVAFETIE